MEEEAAALKERLKEQATPKPKPKPKSRARAPVVQKLQELDRDSLATKFSLTGDQMACYLGFWEQANREGAELDRGNIEQMFLDAGITEAVMADVLQGLGMSMALDMDNDPKQVYPRLQTTFPHPEQYRNLRRSRHSACTFADD